MRVNFKADGVTVQADTSRPAQFVSYDQLPVLIEALVNGAKARADELKAQIKLLQASAKKLEAVAKPAS